MYRCTGCGSTETIEEIRRHHPQAISCCPERNMQSVVVTDEMVERAREAINNRKGIRGALEAALSENPSST